MADEERDEAEGGRPRPRVVDRRISARKAEAPAPEPAEAPAEPEQAEAEDPPSTAGPGPASTDPPSTAAPQHDPVAGAGEEPLWTPEQEAEARRVIDQIAQVPSSDWVADSAVRLANVAGVKLDQGNLAEAQLAIDALSGLLSSVGARLGEAEQPLRQTLAQLQVAFTQSATGPPQPQPGK